MLSYGNFTLNISNLKDRPINYKLYKVECSLRWDFTRNHARILPPISCNINLIFNNNNNKLRAQLLFGGDVQS